MCVQIGASFSRTSSNISSRQFSGPNSNKICRSTVSLTDHSEKEPEKVLGLAGVGDTSLLPLEGTTAPTEVEEVVSIFKVAEED